VLRGEGMGLGNGGGGAGGCDEVRLCSYRWGVRRGGGVPRPRPDRDSMAQMLSSLESLANATSGLG
jgi:hypothetical protein